MYTSMISGKPDVSMTLNGALAGLVGITAGCANVNNLGAVLIGLASGVLVVYSINFIEKKGFDDAVGAISVHGICGAWGVLAEQFLILQMDYFMVEHHFLLHN